VILHIESTSIREACGIPQQLAFLRQDQQKASCLSKVQMEHDENVVISDNDGTMGHDEATVDADPTETTPNPLRFNT